MHMLKKIAVISITSFALFSQAPAYAEVAMDDQEFQYALKHANFMPTLMQTIMKNKDALALDSEQLKKFKNYKSQNAPAQHADMKAVVKLEKKAAAAASKGDLEQAQIYGQQSIALRQTLMNQKLRCHQMVKETLTAEQYQKLLTLIK